MAEEIILSDRNVERKTLGEELTRLYSQGFLTDITLSTEDGKNFEAHRVLLAARSTYFHSIVSRLKTDPVIFFKGIKGSHLDKILKFIYGNSVAVSKTQLKPILEVAKALQVKGLQDVTATEILSKQSVVSAGRFKPDSPLGSPLLTKSSHHSKLVDKTTLTTFKRPTRGMAPTLQSPRSMQNGANSDSDSADKSKDDGDNDGESNSVGTRRTKRGRGRPPKNRNASSSKDSAKGKEDPYEFEEDSNDGHDRSDRKRKSKASNHDDDDDDDEDQAEEETRSRRDRGSRHGISGKEVISVKCQKELADLYVSRFVSGAKGQCIKHKDQWVTPYEFAMLSGYNGKKYLENIQTDYGPLKALTASGMLKLSQQRRRGKEDESPKDKKSSRKRKANDDDDDDDGDDDDDDNDHGGDHGAEDNDDQDEDEDEYNDAVTETETGSQTMDSSSRSFKKKKKKKHSRDSWKREILKSENAAMAASTLGVMTTMAGHEDPTAQMQQNDGVVSTIISSGYQLSLDHSSKISHSTMIPTDQTIYVMSSPHPSMATPPTPHHNPFAGSMSPHPSQMQSTTLLPVVSTASLMSAAKPTPGGVSGGLSRIGNILNIRCKSTTAQLYANKYESGSKGKCILLGDEWLTPNEFEDRAGSKAKKYLSSIKCLGRPLRVYVNSGELRGSGPPPNPKGNKTPKLKANPGNMHTTTNMQPIAPAPTPIQAPPTPTHISSAPGIPQNLSMVMNPQPPILLNQQQIPTSIMGGSSILGPGMTFVAQPIEVRQNGQAM